MSCQHRTLSNGLRPIVCSFAHTTTLAKEMFLFGLMWAYLRMRNTNVYLGIGVRLKAPRAIDTAYCINILTYYSMATNSASGRPAHSRGRLNTVPGCDHSF